MYKVKVRALEAHTLRDLEQDHVLRKGQTVTAAFRTIHEFRAVLAKNRIEEAPPVVERKRRQKRDKHPGPEQGNSPVQLDDEANAGTEEAPQS